MKSGVDEEYEKKKREEVLQEYEDTLKHTYKVPPYGIEELNKSCPYPALVGDEKHEKVDKHVTFDQ